MTDDRARVVACKLIDLGYASKSVAVGAALLGAGNAIGHMTLPDHAPCRDAWRKDAYRCLDTALARTRSASVAKACADALEWCGAQRGTT